MTFCLCTRAMCARRILSLVLDEGKLGVLILPKNFGHYLSGSLCLNFKWSINKCYVFKSVLFYYLLAPIAKVLKVDILNIFWNPKFMKKRNKQDGNGMIFHQKVNVWKMSFFKKDNFFLKVDKMDIYHELESQFWAKNSKRCAV